MKKLTTLFILLFVGSVLFADPKFPKYDINNENDTPYLYVSDDLQSIYEIYAFEVAKGKYTLMFNKTSLINPTHIYIQIRFSSEKKLDDFIKDIDLTDLETSFKVTRQKIIKQGITPDIYVYDKNDKPRKVTETKTVYGYGYDENFDWKTLPSSIIYTVSY